jgi:catechol 2,3-dioxygenase-like lactoylglutathione lyase family enzyme
LRIARPTRDPRASERFWVRGLGLDVLLRADASAEGGHALPMVGWAGDGAVEAETITRLVEAGGTVVGSRNPYWDHGGVTIADPDGYRLVLTSRSWS